MIFGSGATDPEKRSCPDVEIREAAPEEWALLPDFTYEAIFKRPEDGPVPRTVLQHPALKGVLPGLRVGGGPTAARLRWRTGPWSAPSGRAPRRATAAWTLETPELAMSLYPEWRGMGVGSRLLDAMLRLAEGEGWKRISLSVQLDNFARGMYLKAGFEPVEVRDGEAVMVKRIG